MAMANASLVKELKNVPDKPGVYLFKDARGSVLYVGKAKSLIKRVRSYFSKRQELPKVKLLVGRATALDYNVTYRDDKSYPYLAICFDEEWPRVKYTREKHRADTRYFGPYTNARALRETLDTLLKIFPLRA